MRGRHHVESRPRGCLRREETRDRSSARECRERVVRGKVHAVCRVDVVSWRDMARRHECCDMKCTVYRYSHTTPNAPLAPLITSPPARPTSRLFLLRLHLTALLSTLRVRHGWQHWNRLVKIVASHCKQADANTDQEDREKVQKGAPAISFRRLDVLCIRRIRTRWRRR